jgi:hypothetical protein
MAIINILWNNYTDVRGEKMKCEKKKKIHTAHVTTAIDLKNPS